MYLSYDAKSSSGFVTITQLIQCLRLLAGFIYLWVLLTRKLLNHGFLRKRVIHLFEDFREAIRIWCDSFVKCGSYDHKYIIYRSNSPVYNMITDCSKRTNALPVRSMTTGVTSKRKIVTETLSDTASMRIIVWCLDIYCPIFCLWS